jgi:putative ABC transport system permease protein
MGIRPILSALLRNKTGAVLVVLQIAITMAVIVNALFIINQRLEKMNRAPGFDVQNMISFQSWGFAEDYDHETAVRQDVAFISSLPGVIGVTPSRSLPLSNGGDMSDFRATAEAEDADGNTLPNVLANTYYMNEQAIDALGVELAQGRAFYPEEVIFREQNSAAFVPVVIMTKTLANQTFGIEDALGKTFYDSYGAPAEVVGIIEHMQGGFVDWDELENVLIMPGVAPGPFLRYIVRVEPGRREELLAVIEEQLPGQNPARMIRRIEPYTDIVARSYRRDHSMTILLMSTIFLLVSITSLGIIGLASFSVRQRTKQIGTRRAVGATRADIMRYFMVENWLVTTMGVIVGAILAVVFNVWLVDTYALEKLDLLYIPFGVVALWILGQLAVLMPAIKAAGIAPAIATRTV